MVRSSSLLAIVLILTVISLTVARKHRQGKKAAHPPKNNAHASMGPMASMSPMGTPGPNGELPPCHACEEHARRMKNFKCITKEYPHFLGPCIPTQMEKGVEILGLLCPPSFICLVNNGIDFGCCGKKPITAKQRRQEKRMSQKQLGKLMKLHRKMFEQHFPKGHHQPMEAGQGPLPTAGAPAGQAAQPGGVPAAGQPATNPPATTATP